MEVTPATQRLGHDLSNQLSIILGFSELLLAAMPDADPRKADLLEIEKAAKAAMALVAQSLTRPL
jgi:signal transduction histidine kinase